MKKLLLTGFEPFLTFTVNPTMKIVEELDGMIIGGYEVTSKVLSVDFAQSGAQLVQYLEELKADAVISLGLAGGRYKITPERIAINVKDGAADNQGHVPIDENIQLDGNPGYFSTLPIRLMIDELKKEGLPAAISNTAGTYLCNNVMYESLHYAQMNNLNMLCGFIHIPASHELAIQHGKIPSWSHADLKRGVEICIGTLEKG